MNVRRSMTVGAVAALLAGGCASQLPSSTPANGSGPGGAPATSADHPKWEARGGPSDGRPTPQQLAERAANYAKTMESPAPATVAASAKSATSSVQFDAPATPAAPSTAPAPLVATSPAPPVPPDPRAALLAKATQGNPIDIPVSVPEGAEFTTALRAVDPLGTRLAKRAKAHPQDPGAQFDYQLYVLLSGGTESAEPQLLMSTVGLPPDERDVIAAIVDGISNFRSVVTADPNLTPTQQVRPLQDMVDHLRAGTDLSLGAVALCKRVTGFGLYEPLTPARFPVGRSSPLLVYSEVDNFLPRHMPDGQWETRLAQRVSLYTAAGTVAWEDKARGVTDTCRNRRRDFFTKEPVTLPPTLPAGAYKLKVTVTDRNANKVAESDVPLWVGGN